MRVCIRHFPMAGKHARGPALHAAAEAAGRQRPEAFWGLCDRIYANLGRQDDPHLWAWARELGLEQERFERERRSLEVEARVRRDFESGIRAGVTGTPAAFVEGRLLNRQLISELPLLADAERS
jgi:protein-disulfide isomerase